MAEVRLTIDQWADHLRSAGVPEHQVPTMAAIAMAESGGNSGAFNDNASTGDKSYGGFQINMIDLPGYQLGKERREKWGIRNEQLFDPAVNAMAAKKVLENQGLKAWSVYNSGAYKKYLPGGGNPSLKPAYSQSSIDLPGSVQAATLSSEGLPDVSLGDLSGAFSATFPGSDISNSQGVDRFAASSPVVAGIQKIFGDQEQQVAIPLSVGLSADSQPASEKAWQIAEYLTGDRGHGGYREDHGGSNYHEHLAFQTTAGRDRAMKALTDAGIQIGSVNDGKHAPNSYHYQDLAFDVPAHQVPVGQEQALSRRVRGILGMA